MDKCGSLRVENVANRDASLQLVLLTLLLHRSGGRTPSDAPRHYPSHEVESELQQMRPNATGLTHLSGVS